MSNESNLVFQNGGWYTCGCDGKPKVLVQLPAGSTTIFMRLSGRLYGPVSGLEYEFAPHQNSLDVDHRDAKFWLDNGQAKPQLTGYRGRMTRTGRSNVKKE